ncbi:hypothetical protein EVAR_30950_1 [Eumeta japonica]|uniref:Uncharacterized protein n=1 Tax=Eumeta variegata TaxID=151549 RepID=A0A4C1V496_EUMVA|nr:hypothetical protein EVAR_30950_1 [Eumeta japonica]
MTTVGSSPQAALSSARNCNVAALRPCDFCVYRLKPGNNIASSVAGPERSRLRRRSIKSSLLTKFFYPQVISLSPSVVRHSSSTVTCEEIRSDLEHAHAGPSDFHSMKPPGAGLLGCRRLRLDTWTAAASIAFGNQPNRSKSYL